MRCIVYRKGNLGNPHSETSPRPWENHRKRRKRAGPHRGTAEPTCGPAGGMPECCRPAHRLRSQQDCPLQASALRRAQSLLTAEVRGAPANPSTAAVAHKTLPKCYWLLSAPGWSHDPQGNTSILCRAFQGVKGSLGPHLPWRESVFLPTSIPSAWGRSGAVRQVLPTVLAPAREEQSQH